MPRMQRTGQRPCSDVSALRRAGHRHHQTETESGFDWLGHPVRRSGYHWRHLLDHVASHNGQGAGTAPKLPTAAPAALKFARGIGIDISPMPVRHGQTPARRLHLPVSERLRKAGCPSISS
jgi:hypothetical protein